MARSSLAVVGPVIAVVLCGVLVPGAGAGSRAGVASTRLTVGSGTGLERAAAALRSSGGTIVLRPRLYEELVIRWRGTKLLRIVGTPGTRVEQVVFDRRERVMISGVLNLAERPIRTVMTVRAKVDAIDLSQPAEAITQMLVNSSYSRLPLIRDGRIEEPLGYVHKKELLKELLAGNQPALEHLVNLGHRRIAVIKGQDFSSDTKDRWSAIRDAARRLKAPIHPALVTQLEGDKPSPETGYVATQRLLSAGEPFTALFAFNDISAIGAMRSVGKVPARISRPKAVTVPPRTLPRAARRT